MNVLVEEFSLFLRELRAGRKKQNDEEKTGTTDDRTHETRVEIRDRQWSADRPPGPPAGARELRKEPRVRRHCHSFLWPQSLMEICLVLLSKKEKKTVHSLPLLNGSFRDSENGVKASARTRLHDPDSEHNTYTNHSELRYKLAGVL